MLDIEKFSEYCWCGDNPRKWNMMKGRGILYRGRDYVLDYASPFPVIFKQQDKPKEEGRGFTWGT